VAGQHPRRHRAAGRTIIAKMPHVPQPNYAVPQQRRFDVHNLAAAWGLDAAGFSNGAAYVDLVRWRRSISVVNNLNRPGRGLSATACATWTVPVTTISPSHARLRARIRRDWAQRWKIAAGGTHQLVEVMPTRGFEIIGRSARSLWTRRDVACRLAHVVWPDRRYQILTNVSVDRAITLVQTDAHGDPPIRPSAIRRSFRTSPIACPSANKHVENTFFDFGREPLMSHLLSTEGPALGRR